MARFEELIQGKEGLLASLRDSGTYVFYRALKSEVLYAKSDWIKKMRTQLEDMPQTFWNLLRFSFQARMEHYLKRPRGRGAPQGCTFLPRLLLGLHSKRLLGAVRDQSHLRAFGPSPCRGNEGSDHSSGTVSREVRKFPAERHGPRSRAKTGDRRTHRQEHHRTVKVGSPVRRKLLFLLVLFLGFAAASCRTEVKGFTFRDGKGADIQLFAGSSKSSSEDGFVSLKDGPASFSLKAPAEIGEGTGLRLKAGTGASWSDGRGLGKAGRRRRGFHGFFPAPGLRRAAHGISTFPSSRYPHGFFLQVLGKERPRLQGPGDRPRPLRGFSPPGPEPAQGLVLGPCRFPFPGLTGSSTRRSPIPRGRGASRSSSRRPPSPPRPSPKSS